MFGKDSENSRNFHECIEFNSYIDYLKNKDRPKCLQEFEKLNKTTDSIYDLGNLNALIILKDGTNLTRWLDVDNKSEVLYVSEDLSGYTDLSRRYSGLTSLKAIVATGVSANVTNTEGMFRSCESLVDISSLKDWNVSNVCNMRSMFHGCRSIRDFSGLKDWDVSRVENMQGMFNSCRSLENLNFMKDWRVSNVTNMNHMFYSCWGLNDLSALKNWDVSRVGNMKWMFCGCKNLKNLYGLNDWKVSRLLEIDYMFMGCEGLTDVSDINGWNLNRRMWRVFFSCGELNNFPKWYKSFDGFGGFAV